MEKGVRMDRRSMEVRRRLRDMAPATSIPYIQSFQLPAEEELVLIEADARRKSVQQIAMEANMSVESVKRRRKAALRKLSGDLFLTF